MDSGMRLTVGPPVWPGIRVCSPVGARQVPSGRRARRGSRDVPLCGPSGEDRVAVADLDHFLPLWHLEGDAPGAGGAAFQRDLAVVEVAAAGDGVVVGIKCLAVGQGDRRFVVGVVLVGAGGGVVDADLDADEMAALGGVAVFVGAGGWVDQFGERDVELGAAGVADRQGGSQLPGAGAGGRRAGTGGVWRGGAG